MTTKVVIGDDVETKQPVSIDQSARARSTYVIGIQGMGKSTLLESMAHQDMQNGDGLCFIDPHGESVLRLLESIPGNRANEEVVFLNPYDKQKSFGLNPFYCADPTDGIEVSRVANEFIADLASLAEFAATFQNAPRMKNFLSHLAITFIVNQGYTLAETHKFIRSQLYRETFYPALLKNGHRAVVDYWYDFDDMTPNRQDEESASSLNKLLRFQLNPIMRHIFGQPTSSINFRSVMDEGKIILIKLFAHDLGEDNAAFIGAFLVREILQAAFSRSDQASSLRKQFHLYADEFQTFMSTAFPMLLQQARKFGVDCVVAHQSREQLQPEVRELTRAVGNLVIFRITYPNADSLAGEFDTTPPSELRGSRRPILTTAVDPWRELITKGHKNPEVVGIISRLRKLFYHRNIWLSDPRETELDEFFGGPDSEFYTRVWWVPYPQQARPQEKPKGSYGNWSDSKQKGLYPGKKVRMKYPLTMETVSEWANPYLLACEQGRDDIVVFQEMVNRFSKLTHDSSRTWWGDETEDFDELPKHPVDWYFAGPFEAQYAVWWFMQEAIAKAFAKEMKRLGEILSQDPIMTESGQYEVLPEIRTYADRGEEIANELVGLPLYRARCKLIGSDKRTTEHLISTSDFQGNADAGRAASIIKRSRGLYSCERSAVEDAIARRLGRGSDDERGAGQPEPDGRPQRPGRGPKPRPSRPERPRDELDDPTTYGQKKTPPKSETS